MTKYYIPEQSHYWRSEDTNYHTTRWDVAHTKRDVIYTDEDLIIKTRTALYFTLPGEAAPWKIVAFRPGVVQLREEV